MRYACSEALNMQITNTETFMAQRITVQTAPASTETWARLSPDTWVYLSYTGPITGNLNPSHLEQLYRQHLEK